METYVNNCLFSESCKSREEKNIDKSIEFIRFVVEMKSWISKCKYRRVISEIESKDEYFEEINNNWNLRQLKIVCILKILDKKLKRIETIKNLKTKSIDNWIKKIDNILEGWFNNIYKIEQNQYEIEVIFTLILEQFYFIAKYKFSENFISDCSSILGISERIIKNFVENSRYPKLFNISQKILLFLSSLHISDNDFEKAIEYQDFVIKLSVKELFLRLDLEEDETNKNHNKKLISYRFNKLFINIVLAFYHRGIVEENLGNMINSIHSYKQAVWFSQKFCIIHFPEISQFLEDVEKRAIDYHVIIDARIKEKNSEFIKKSLNEKMSPLKNKIFKNHSQKNINEEKNNILIKILNGLEFPDLDFVEDQQKSEKVKNILSTLTLLNNFSSSEFRDILKDHIEDKSLNKLDLPTLEKIEKRINSIKSERIYNNIEKEKKREENKNRIINSIILKENIGNKSTINDNEKDLKYSIINDNRNNISNVSKNFISFRENNDAEKFLNEPKDKNTLTKISDYLNKTEKSRGKSCNKFNKKNVCNNIIDYKVDSYIFSKKYQSKLKNLEDLTKKEIDFQKRILNSKRHEKLPMDVNNLNDSNLIKTNAESFFERIISQNLTSLNPNLKKVKKIEKLKIGKSKTEKKIQKLEVSMIKSLDTKVYQNWDDIKKQRDKLNHKMFSDQLNIIKFRDNSLIKLDESENISKINLNEITRIENDIDILKKEEFIFKKLLLPKKPLNVKVRDRSSLKSYRNDYVDVDSFTKIIKPFNSTINSKLESTNKFNKYIF